MALTPAADSMTAEGWATLVLQDLGVPVSANNLTFMAQWMASENSPSTWTGTAGANNPLNNGLGSGGGSGLGSYPDLTTAAKFAAQNLAAGNFGYDKVVANLKADAAPSITAQSIISSSWAGGHYGGGANWAGGVTGQDTAFVSTNDQTSYTSGATAGGGAGSGTVAASASASGTGTGGTNTNPQDSVQVGGQTYTGKTSETSALASISSTMGSYGFSGQDLAQLTQFAWGEITGNVDPSQVVLDLQNQPVFDKRFPGLKERTAAGFDAMSVSDYLSYETQAQQQARALGLPDGFMTSQEIGSLIAGNVSPNELSDRLNNVYVVANNSTPEVKAQLKAYFGADITPGGLAALALDPTKAEPLLQQQLTAAQLGGAGVSAGLGAVTKGTAMEIAQTGITQAGIQSGIGQIAPLAPLETALPGQTTNTATGANVVSVDQLAKGQFLSSQPDQRALQVAQESRTAPFKSGGGDIATQKGVVGLGSASSSGTTAP